VIEVCAGRSKRLPYNFRTRLARWELAEMGRSMLRPYVRTRKSPQFVGQQIRDAGETFPVGR